MSRKLPTIKETTIEEITKAAELLPPSMKKVYRLVTISGADLLLLNKTKVGGKPIEKNTIYTVSLPKWLPVNHKDEMTKIYTESIRTMDHAEAYHRVCLYIQRVNANHQTNGKKKTA